MTVLTKLFKMSGSSLSKSNKACCSSCLPLSEDILLPCSSPVGMPSCTCITYSEEQDEHRKATRNKFFASTLPPKSIQILAGITICNKTITGSDRDKFHVLNKTMISACMTHSTCSFFALWQFVWWPQQNSWSLVEGVITWRVTFFFKIFYKGSFNNRSDRATK